MLTMIRNAVAHFFAIVLVGVMVFCISACGAIERVGQWLDDNPVIAQVAVTQAVARFIEAGDSVERIAERKADAIAVLTKTLSYLDGNPRSRVDAIFAVLNAHIDWDAMSPPDRLLLVEVIRFVQTDLERKQESNQLSEDAALAIRALLQTALRAAEQY
jgi:hypothetical protein